MITSPVVGVVSLSTIVAWPPVPWTVTLISVVVPSFNEITNVSTCSSPSCKTSAFSFRVYVQLPSSSTTKSPYAPPVLTSTNARSGLSGSSAVNWPLTLVTVSSVTVPLPKLTTGKSSVPFTFITTSVVTPFVSSTVNDSVCTSPSANAAAESSFSV